jgi:O-antigen/teichoic acid export membrane protein
MFKKANFSSTYAQGVIALFKGNFWAQSVGLIGTILVAKMYGADSLGIFSKFLSASSILAIFFTLRLEAAFVLSNDVTNLKRIFSSILYSILVGTVIAFIVALTLPDAVFTKINFLRIYVIFCVAGSFLKAIETVFLSYLLKRKKFKNIAFSRVLYTVVRYGFQIGLFYLIPTTGLIIGFIVGLIILLIYFTKVTGNLFLPISFSEFATTIRENQNLVSFGVLSDNLNAVNLHLIPILAGVYFSDEEIGWYFLAIALLSVPVTFINASFSKVFFLRASEIFNTNQTQLYAFVRKYALQLFLGLLIPFVLIFFLSRPFIEFIFQEEWKEVGIYIQLLAFLFYLRSVYNPISHLEEVLKKNHIGLIFNLFLFAATLSSIFYGAWIAKDFEKTIQFIAIILPIGYISMIVYFLRVTQKLRFQKTQ